MPLLQGVIAAPLPVPKLEEQERPEAVAVVEAARLVLVPKPGTASGRK